MTEITVYSSRLLDHEPDTVELVPNHTDYVIVGTYYLQREDSVQEVNSGGSSRNGSLQIITFLNDIFDYNEVPTIVARKDFPCAIVDLHFHPLQQDLLGVATSTAEIRLFYVEKRITDANVLPEFDIQEIGIVRVSDESNEVTTPLVTHFSWITEFDSKSDADFRPLTEVTLCACDTKGVSQFIKIFVPGLQSAHVQNPGTQILEYEILNIHKQQHDLEAWFTTVIRLSDASLPQKRDNSYLVLTGGDDSNVTCSKLTIAPSKSSPEKVQAMVEPQFTLKRKHEAGVVSLRSLRFDSMAGSIPVLTGSYDDKLRLFIFNESSPSAAPVEAASIDLGGGVWRIIQLDEYQSTKSGQTVHHWILLICAMYDGAKVVRLNATIDTDLDSKKFEKITGSNDCQWAFAIEGQFRKGHASMVYAAAAKEKAQKGIWEIVTTSFYDRKVCNWDWRDEQR